ncbi:MAG: Ig-like domain-containing protein, partial [Candidatus Hodarchaeota archaeon]
FSDGPHTAKVIAKEPAQTSWTTAREVQDQIIVHVGTEIQLPALSITAPTAGATVNGTVTITASASEDAIFTIAYVLVTVTGSSGQVLQQNVTSGFGSISVSWDTSAVPNGAYTITVTVTYTPGNTQFKQVAVTVNNQATTSSWTPTPGFDGLSLLLAISILVLLVGSLRLRRKRKR